ncbi:MAG: Ribosome-binding ATPase YchF [Firmicutes bacterium]|nr:Ribosome-binding ATPase YchF [candidate division NPL-UPA2 bacterium]
MPSCGIIGLPMVGKTTMFNLLTGTRKETSKFFSGKTESNQGLAAVRDRRVDFLANLYRPRKTTYAQIEFIDVPGLVRGASEGLGIGNAFLDGIRQSDALVHVVRAFKSDLEHVEGSIDPLRDVLTVAYELLMADVAFVEKRLSRLNDSKKRSAQTEEEMRLLERILEHLESEQPFSTFVLSPEEGRLLLSYTFLTGKPQVLVVNLDDEQFVAALYPHREELQLYARERGLPLLEMSANTEMEVSELDGAERDEFLAELKLDAPGIDRVARASYQVLGLISFFTVAEDEVRAWTVRQGTTAKQAAGKVHSDLERGFIRAEAMRYHDLETYGGAAKLKEKGLVSLEGKDYVVSDGDILSIRFNV